jgi:succinoglycan biosynthesis transport protein ExoP
VEKQVRTAKELHMGTLPEQTLANLQTLAGVRQQLEATHNMIISERDRLALTDRQIQNMKKSGTGPGGSGVASPLQRVLALEAQLAEARAKYLDKHPEVTHLEEELKSARAAAAADQPADGPRQALIESDPAYQHLLAESNLTRLRIQALQRTEKQLLGDIGRYQGRVEAAPRAEQAISSLQREFDLERENHRRLAERHSAAAVQEQIARGRGGERFSVLTAATLPDSPETPNRGRILLMALMGGLALGVAMAYGREFLDRSVRDPRALHTEFDVPVLAEIPRISEAK